MQPEVDHSEDWVKEDPSPVQSHPEDAIEEKIPIRTMEEALRVEQLRSRLSNIRSSIAHIERNMVRDGITAEELDKAVELAIVAEASVFAVRFSLGYP